MLVELLVDYQIFLGTCISVVTLVPSSSTLISSSNRYPFHLGKTTVQMYQYTTPKMMLSEFNKIDRI